MTDRYQHLMHLAPKQLHNHLVRKGYPDLVRQSIYNTVTEQQQRKANSKRRGAQIALAWEPLFNPLANEIRTVRSMLMYGRGSEERIEVLNAYLQAMLKARGVIYGAKLLGMTPRALQNQRKEEGKPPYPNDLTHWSDLVPEKVRAAITTAFDSLPYKPKAKRKTPFMRETEDSGE